MSSRVLLSGRALCETVVWTVYNNRFEPFFTINDVRRDSVVCIDCPQKSEGGRGDPTRLAPNNAVHLT